MNPSATAVLPNGIAHSISREQMALLPIRRYEGEVHQVATSEDLKHAVTDIGQERIIGLDTETRPSFLKGETHLPCLVQVATARKVYLFPLRRPDVFPLLADMLADPRTIKAGVALANDLRALKQVFAFAEQNVLDLGIVARRFGLSQTGLRNLSGIFLGFRVPKGARTSNWAAPRLSPAQITYAATDAWACRELLLRFQNQGLVRSQKFEAAGVGDGSTAR